MIPRSPRALCKWTILGMLLIAVGQKVSAMSQKSPRIAVIGGGAAGLAATRVLSREGLVPKVLEKDRYTGGVWNYVRNSKSRPMYRGLRTNLPKEVMAFREKRWENDVVEESYVTHEDVARYLESYRNDFGLNEFIKFGSKVEQLTVLTDTVSQVSPESETWPQIQLEWEEETVEEIGAVNGDSNNDLSGKKERKSEVFDAVLICNGHYAAPSSPDMPGLKEYFRGRIMHSVEYDDPAEFQGETVLCVGASASGADLAKEIARHADCVYLSDSSYNPDADDGRPRQMGRATRVPRTVEVLPDGTISFEHKDSPTPQVDTIIFCSGYDYSFPFINDGSKLDLSCVPGERRVSPLYENLWHARYPNLAFVGLPFSVVPFPLFEFQAEATLAQWNKLSLPPLDDRLDAAAKDAVAGGGKKDGSIRNTHHLGATQWDYCRRMAKMAGIYNERIEDYITTNTGLYNHSGGERTGRFPGDEIYRSTLYSRDPDDKSFQVVHSKVEAEQTTPV